MSTLLQLWLMACFVGLAVIVVRWFSRRMWLVRILGWIGAVGYGAWFTNEGLQDGDWPTVWWGVALGVALLAFVEWAVRSTD